MRNLASGLIVPDDLPKGKNTEREYFFSLFLKNIFLEKYKFFFRNSLIVMSNLPSWKNTRIFQKGSHCNGWPTQVKKYKDFSGDLILMGGLPRSKLEESHYDGTFQIEKYTDFSGGLILTGDLLRSWISRKWEIFPNHFQFGHFKVAFLLMVPIRDFFYEICKTHF